MLQSLPNPFVSQTVIRYAVPAEAQTTLGIYNLSGQLIRTLVDENTSEGSHSVIWDGSDDRGDPVAAGIYYYQLESGEFSNVRKMLLIE